MLFTIHFCKKIIHPTGQFKKIHSHEKISTDLLSLANPSSTSLTKSRWNWASKTINNRINYTDPDYYNNQTYFFCIITPYQLGQLQREARSYQTRLCWQRLCTIDSKRSWATATGCGHSLKLEVCLFALGLHLGWPQKNNLKQNTSLDPLVEKNGVLSEEVTAAISITLFPFLMEIVKVFSKHH